MKVSPSIKKRCKDCQMIKRRGRLMVICSSIKRHKQRQG